MSGELPDLVAPGVGDIAAERFDQLIRQTIDPLALVQRVADQLIAMLEAADGVLVGLIADEGTLRYVCGSGELRGHVGEQLAMRGSLSGHAIDQGKTLVTDDTELDGRVNRAATRAFGVRSSVCVPLGLRDEPPVGVLSVSSARVRAFGGRDIALLDGLAQFISTLVRAATDLMATAAKLSGEARPADPAVSALTNQFVASVLDPFRARQIEVREQIGTILRSGAFTVVVQPMFDTCTGDMFGLEALARFTSADSPPPDVLIRRAHAVGLGVELELALLEAALKLLGQLPEWAMLNVNVGAEALCTDRFTRALGAVDCSRVVAELTEHVKVNDYPRLAAALTRMRDAGTRLAIDDAGAGYSSLMHILRLAPDFIKLDRQLISGIDIDPVRRSLTASLKRFADETGATLIAEGVESEAELGALADLDIHHAQGYHLARPMPVAEIAALLGRTAARLPRDKRISLVGSSRARA